MKITIKITAVVSAIFVSSAAMGVTGIDRLKFTPSFIFQEGNYAELLLVKSNPSVSPTFADNANVTRDVNTVSFAYKHQFSDKLGLGLMVNTQPNGVDIDFSPLGSTLRGAVDSNSVIGLGHFKVTDRISLLGGFKHQAQQGNADLRSLNPTVPGATTFQQDTDVGYIFGAAYSIPKIALRVSLTYEEGLDFNHNTIIDGPGFSIGNTTSATPDTYLLEFQTGIAKNTLLFGHVRRAFWDDAQVFFVGGTPLSNFDNTTDYKLGIGRKFSDSISGSVTLSYEPDNDLPSSPFSPQDGERGIAVGLKYTAKSGFATSLGVQYRRLGDTITTTQPLPFTDNDVVTVGLKFAQSF